MNEWKDDLGIQFWTLTSDTMLILIDEISREIRERKKRRRRRRRKNSKRKTYFKILQNWLLQNKTKNKRIYILSIQGKIKGLIIISNTSREVFDLDFF